MSSPLSLDDIVSISVTVSSSSVTANTFNIGLIVGASTAITTTTRLKRYALSSYTTSMIADGFTIADPEYIAAGLYFGQNTAAPYVYVGVKGSAESWLEAVTACRAASDKWYGLMVTAPADADNLALASYANTNWRVAKYYGWSSASAIPAGTAGNIFLEIQAASYKSTLMTYSTTQSAAYPNNIYAAAAVMGVEMGLNTNLAGSFFTVAHKELVGIYVEPLTETEYSNIVDASGNVYATFGAYDMYEPGFTSDGKPSYLYLFLAMLVAQLQTNIMDAITTYPVIPQTNSGQAILLGKANKACKKMVTIGFLAEGVWESATVLNLSEGTTVPNGYLNQSESYAEQSTSDRDAGKAMPIYTCVTTAGAVQSIAIGVYAQL